MEKSATMLTLVAHDGGRPGRAARLTIRQPLVHEVPEAVVFMHSKVGLLALHDKAIDFLSRRPLF